MPATIALPFTGPPMVAVGADLKNSVCITRDGEAFVSQHLGDLASPLGFGLFEETIAKLLGLLDVKPPIVAAKPLSVNRGGSGWPLYSTSGLRPVFSTTSRPGNCRGDVHDHPPPRDTAGYRRWPMV